MLADCDFVIPYLGDILIKSGSRDQHVEHIECVFEKTREFCMVEVFGYKLITNHYHQFWVG